MRVRVPSSGEPGNIVVGAIKTAPLEVALSSARQLQCRTQQARWIFDVADTVLDLRKCVLTMDYNNMLRVINAVRSTDKAVSQVCELCGTRNHAACACPLCPYCSRLRNVVLL